MKNCLGIVVFMMRCGYNAAIICPCDTCKVFNTQFSCSGFDRQFIFFGEGFDIDSAGFDFYFQFGSCGEDEFFIIVGLGASEAMVYVCTNHFRIGNFLYPEPIDNV